MTLTFGSLFAGIGGFDLGFERAGMVCRWQVEIDDFCNKVLANHWPDVTRYRDVRECGEHNLEPVDVICGGFPCQPFSEAGEQRGAKDDRNLWPEFKRIIAELKPAWIVAENVPGIRNIYLERVLSDLEGLDYTTETIDIPAVAMGARHIRHRFWIIAHSTKQQMGIARQSREFGRVEIMAYTNGNNGHGRGGIVQNGRKSSQEKIENSSNGSRIKWPAQSEPVRVAYGIPNRVDRLRSLGNAVVPQVAEFIGSLIVAAERAKLPLEPGAGE